MTDITHGYEGMGKSYAEARKGTPAFAEFVINNSGLEQAVSSDRPLLIIEFGVGGGQQTKFVEDQLRSRGIGNYMLLAIDKSFGFNEKDEPGHLDVLKDRIELGEISSRVIPFPYNIEAKLPFPTNSADLAYFAFVIHHLTNKAGFFNEAGRITKKGARFFSFDAALEDLADHPLDEFFPEKPKYDSLRYPTREQIKVLFENAGFAYQQQRPLILRDDDRPIDERFLEAVGDIEKKSPINSVLEMIKKDDPEAFKRGLARVRDAVGEGRRTGNYRTFKIYRAVDWGIKQ